MKSKKWFLIIGVPVIMLVLAFALKICYVETDCFDQIHFRYYSIEQGTYKRLYIKKHSLTKFSKLKTEMEFDDVFKLVGKPTWVEGNAITWFEFKLANYWYIRFRLRFSDKGLCDIRIVDYPSRREFKLEQVNIEKNVYQKLDTKPKHSLAKFSKINIGMTPDEVVELAGKPTDSVSSDIIWYRYKIDKGWYMDLPFHNEKLSDMSIVDYSNNRVFELEQDEYITTLPCLTTVAQTSGGNAVDTFTDNRDGRTYRTVKIGSLTWMVENLNFVMDSSVCYDNDESNCQKYGRLYNWETAMKACPAGWRLSSDEDWVNLALAAAGKCNGRVHWKIAGKKLKSKTNWSDWGGNGTDDYGFSALPGGLGDFDSSFSYAGNIGYWWSATESDATSANFWDISRGLDREDDKKTRLRCVRCVRE